MGIFSGKKTRQPDTSLQEAEARRQAEIEATRQQALLEEQRRLQEQTRADNERRYAEQLRQQQEENERQRTHQTSLVERQLAAQAAEVARQEAGQRAQEGKRDLERQETLAQTQQAATRAREYATGRQGLIDQSREGIESAYAKFDDKFFGDFAQSFIDQNKPALERGYQGERRATKLGFADTGNLRSTAAARSFGDLKTQLTTNQGKLANAGYDAAENYRDDIERQKSDALSLVMSGGGVGAETLPDGVTDVGGSLNNLGSRLGSLTTTQANRARTIRAPTFSSPNLDLSFGARKPQGGRAFA